MRARLWSVAFAGCVLAAGCFEIEEPPPDAGVTGAALNGRVLVVGTQTAQSTDVGRALKRTRNAIAQLASGDAITVHT